MPRSARKESGCGIYHVMMRGVNRQAIFDDDEDCRRFMDILADLPFQHDDDGRLLPIRTKTKTITITMGRFAQNLKKIL